MIFFLTEQKGETSLFVLSQLVAVSFVAFSFTWPWFSVTAAGHLPETGATLLFGVR